MNRITSIVPRDKANPPLDLYNDLLNEAIGIISDLIGPVETSWDNDTGGDLTLSGYTFALPRDCVEPQSVEWDTVPLTRMSRAQLDEYDEQWREASGTPAYWFADGINGYLDCTPTGTVTGMLVLRGIGNIPEFPANDAESPNPLSYFPGGFLYQYLPADFVISSLPLIPVEPASDKPEAIRWAEMQTKIRMDTRDRHEKKWQVGLAQLADAYNKRQMDIFRF